MHVNSMANLASIVGSQTIPEGTIGGEDHASIEALTWKCTCGTCSGPSSCTQKCSHGNDTDGVYMRVIVHGCVCVCVC